MPGRGMGERLAVDPNKTSTLYFAAPSGNRSSAAFGTITSAYDPRQMQLGVKVLW